MRETAWIGAVLALWSVTLPLAAVAQNPQAKAAGSAGNVAVTGNELATLVGDPKLPGKYSYKMWSRDATGIVAGGDTYTADLHDVTAIMFQKGVPTARMKAPEARGNSRAEQISASGRVTIWSLIQPGTYLQADQIIWYKRLDRVVATGHVFYYNSKDAVTIMAPSMVADTALKSLSTGGPGTAHMPRLPGMAGDDGPRRKSG